MPPRAVALARRCWNAIARQPQDAARAWRGEVVVGRPALRLARYGDCSWRDMPLGHGRHTPPGYPRDIAGELIGRHETGLLYSDVVCLHFKDLPRNHAELVRFLTFDEPPDVVLVQVGANHALRVVLPNHRAVVRLREDLARWFDRYAGLAYRLKSPWLRTFGRLAFDYRGADELVRFAGLVRSRWPDAELVVLAPFPIVVDGQFDPAVVERITTDTAAVCDRHGLRLLDYGEELRAHADTLYGANGMNLTVAGHRLVGRRLTHWILANGLVERAHRAASEPAV